MRAVASPSNHLVLSASRDGTAVSWTRPADTQSWSEASSFTPGGGYINAVTYVSPQENAHQGPFLIPHCAKQLIDYSMVFKVISSQAVRMPPSMVMPSVLLIQSPCIRYLAIRKMYVPSMQLLQVPSSQALGISEFCITIEKAIPSITFKEQPVFGRTGLSFMNW